MENKQLINHIHKWYPNHNWLSLQVIYMIMYKTVSIDYIMNWVHFTLHASQQDYYFKISRLAKDHLKFILYAIHAQWVI